MTQGLRMLIRSILCLGGELVCFALMVMFALIARAFLAGGAGTQLGLLAVNSWGVLIGMVGLIGFSVGSFLAFAVGIYLCAIGFIAPEQQCIP
jgi:hypothetical protein